jgi:hypothetical protein
MSAASWESQREFIEENRAVTSRWEDGVRDMQGIAQ